MEEEKHKERARNDEETYLEWRNANLPKLEHLSLQRDLEELGRI